MMKGKFQADKGPAPKMWPNKSAKFCGLDSSHLFYYFELGDFVHIMNLFLVPISATRVVVALQ
jgi:hypothetical protein